MAKRALCVGINDYPAQDNDLNGCVRDARAWARLLREHYDFPKVDVHVLLDGKARKKDILRELKWLLTGQKKGDVLVFTNSSHGTYEYDEDRDDDGRYDECLCPYDIDTQVVKDDELRALFSELKTGVSLSVISDSCHSGTVTRAITERHGRRDTAAARRRVRFYSPALRGKPVIARPWTQSARRKSKYPESRMKEVLLSGCQANEYSYDDWFPGGYHGAMSYYALQAIREANYKITYAKLHARVVQLLDDNEYPQSPQLEGKTANKKRQIFT